MTASDPESPLSSLASDDDMGEEVSTPNRSSRPSIDTQDAQQPPSKKRRTGGGVFTSFSATDRAASSAIEHESDIELSEDTEGSAPGSPSHDEHALRADQITACQWESCPVGDLGNSDHLIKHVQDDHISPKRAKYTCEWGECARKGAVHPSGYALKAHMRSHTKEKPFFCNLPECDRSFTRSDALAKHMRTVHEPEPAKQTAAAADSTPGQPKKGPKIRLVNGKGAAAAAAAAAAASAASAVAPGDASSILSPSDPNYDPSPANDNIQYIPACHPLTGQPGFMITYPPDIHFSQFESEIPANQLMRLLRRQLHWANEESEQLKSEVEELERIKQDEWRKKEALLQGVMATELEIGLENDLIQDALKADMERDAEGAKQLEWTRTPRWKKQQVRIKDRAPSEGAAAGLDGAMDIDRDGESEAPAQRDDEDAGSEDEDADDNVERADDDEVDKMEDVEADKMEDVEEARPDASSQADGERDAIAALMGMGMGKAAA